MPILPSPRASRPGRLPRLAAAVLFALGSLPVAQAANSAPAPAVAPLPESAATRETSSPLLWYDASLLRIEGRAYDDTPTTWSRLPARAQETVPSSVWWLSRNTAGLAVRFETDSTTIGAIWDGGQGMNHMAPSGSNGLDLYARQDGAWVFCGVGRPSLKTTPTQALLTSDRPATMTEYLLYLPLYAPVTELKIGIAPGARIAPAAPRPEGERPIVFYGTSITQGGCASRAGMCHPALLGRWLDREVINLGFSGSGKMEPALADLVSEIDASLFVLETLPNMTTEMVKERVEPFVRTLRARHPRTPILLVENPLRDKKHPQNQALRAAFERLRAEGVTNLHCLPGEPQLAGLENGTVDGVHPTDLGFLRMAQYYHPVVKDLLERPAAATP